MFMFAVGSIRNNPSPDSRQEKSAGFAEVSKLLMMKQQSSTWTEPGFLHLKRMDHDRPYREHLTPTTKGHRLAGARLTDEAHMR